MPYTAAVITVSDKGAQGLRTDTSGPAISAILESRGWSVEHRAIIPDEAEQIKQELISCADEKKINLILTTGGTGFSPRDVTPEATLAVIERETRGIPEAMRAESMRITPRGCLSRSAAGIRGRSLIVNLPGSEKAAKENLLCVMDALEHGLEMLLGSGSADCAQQGHHHHHHHHEHHRHTDGDGCAAPSIDSMLARAKAAPDADKVGMYLSHCGVVRGTAKAAVRHGRADAPAVSGMRFSHDRAKVDAAVSDSLKLPGIHYIDIWLAEGELAVGQDLMRIIIGGDIRPNVIAALEYLVDRVKNDCVEEKEIY